MTGSWVPAEDATVGWTAEQIEACHARVDSPASLVFPSSEHARCDSWIARLQSLVEEREQVIAARDSEIAGLKGRLAAMRMHRVAIIRGLVAGEHAQESTAAMGPFRDALEALAPILAVIGGEEERGE